MKQYGNLPLEEAIQRITAHTPQTGVQTLPLRDTLGRIAAQTYYAPLSLPPFDRSPLDGYAVIAEDSSLATPNSPIALRVVDRIYAGSTPVETVTPGTAVRIMTGGMLPPGANAVIRQEDTDYGEEEVLVYHGVQPWQNYIYQGEDLEKGSLLIAAEERITAVEIGILANAGIAELEVYSLPTIVVFATGDELSPIGQPLPPGKIYDSNLHYLVARLTELGCTVTESDFVGDHKALLAERMEEASTYADIIITTGGVSVGEKDLMPQVLEDCGGTKLFWGMACKPGSPALAWILNKTLVLSLSGNPFAAAATFELLARPALCKATHGMAAPTTTTTGVLLDSFPKGSPLRRFVRAKLQDGDILLPEKHSSGVLSSMRGCNCLVDLPAGPDSIAAGTTVQVILL